MSIDAQLWQSAVFMDIAKCPLRDKITRIHQHLVENHWPKAISYISVVVFLSMKFRYVEAYLQSKSSKFFKTKRFFIIFWQAHWVAKPGLN